MKFGIFAGVMMTLFASAKATQQSKNPTLVYYIEHEEDAKQDYVEIALEIQAEDTSLVNAINEAASTVNDVTQQAVQFCKENVKKGNCKQVVDAGKFQIQPRYQLIRKQPVFMDENLGFTVTHQMTINVKSVDNIGVLVDSILKKEGITLKSFEWKAEKEPNTHEEAIAQGMQQGKGLCEQLGLQLGRVISIEQMHEDEPEQEAQGEQQQQEEEQQQEQVPQSASFKFEVECAKKSKETKKA